MSVIVAIAHIAVFAQKCILYDISYPSADVVKFLDIEMCSHRSYSQISKFLVSGEGDKFD